MQGYAMNQCWIVRARKKLSFLSFGIKTIFERMNCTFYFDFEFFF